MYFLTFYYTTIFILYLVILEMQQILESEDVSKLTMAKMEMEYLQDHELDHFFFDGSLDTPT